MDALAVVWLMASRDRNRASEVYSILGERFCLGRRTRYLNLGYWAQTDDYDDACDALAEQLGLAVGLGPGDRLLDVGFGFGDQDDYWLHRFSPASITGLNLTPLQVRTASTRFTDPRIQFRLGSATAMELPDAGFDRVMALECAFHFDTREAFFCEAFRVLRPGGRLGLADILPMPGTLPFPDRILVKLMRAFFQIPDANWMGRTEYETVLLRAGFEDLRVCSIRDQVYSPLWQYALTLARDPASNRALKAIFSPGMVRRASSMSNSLEYLIISARKPG